MSHPTPYSHLNHVLSELVGQIRDVLADDLVTACLQGSFAVGDFDGHSDVDFVIAVRQPLSDAQVEALPWDTRPIPEVAVRTPADPVDFERTLALMEWIIAACQRGADRSGAGRAAEA